MCFNETHMKTYHMHVPSIDHKSYAYTYTTRWVTVVLINFRHSPHFCCCLELPLHKQRHLMKNDAASIGTLTAHRHSLPRASRSTTWTSMLAPAIPLWLLIAKVIAKFSARSRSHDARPPRWFNNYIWSIYFIIPPLVIISSNIYYATTWRLF
jgi:hypothetical protein